MKKLLMGKRMTTMTLTQKALLAGLGVLAIGLSAGYLLGAAREYGDDDGRRGAALRSGEGIGYGASRGDDRANGMMKGQGNQGGLGRGEGAGAGRAEDRMGGRGGNGNFDRKNCVSDECLFVDGLDYPAAELSDAAKSALLSAIDDEYKAVATYDAVMAKQGRVRPFVMVARAEEQHIASLKSLLDKYGVAVPDNQWAGKVSIPDTMIASCQAGVDAEIANASLYRDKLLPAAAEYQDITGVFTNLMNASQNRHLPAFDRCN